VLVRLPVIFSWNTDPDQDDDTDEDHANNDTKYDEYERL
jgi:hypothetical protein